MNSVIETQNLTKTYNGNVVAVTGLDLAVPRGTVYGLIGRNGAGKTTTLRLLMGLLKPDAGSARILGLDFWKASRLHRQKVAYVSQSQQLPGWMTLADFSRYHACFYEKWDEAFLRRMAAQWELPWNRPLARMSGGQQRMAAIALSLAARPEVLLLDEPAAGLDPIARRALLEGIVDSLSQAGGCTILFSTHLIAELQRVADAVGILDRGRLIANERLSDLLEQTKRVQVVFEQESPPPGFNIPGAMQRLQVAGPVATAIVKVTQDAQFNDIRQIPGARVNLFPVNLEDLFIELFSRSPRDMENTDASCPNVQLFNSDYSENLKKHTTDAYEK
jgi:ABC-2 type transport system ATP-binding protein